MFVADTLEEAATMAGLDLQVLRATVDQYNSDVKAGEDPDFGRKEFNGKVETGPFVISKLEMHYHLTFGGLVIDTNAHVLDEAGQPISGLYAAGDVTNVPYKQIVIAMGEGAKAALSAFDDRLRGII